MHFRQTIIVAVANTKHSENMDNSTIHILVDKYSMLYTIFSVTIYM